MSTPETPFSLLVVGPGIDVTYPLSRQPITIGRSRVAMPDVEITDPDAAPRHCVLQWNVATGAHALRVFGMTGAWLNGTHVPGDGAVHPLAPGDEFRIGGTKFRYQSAARKSAPLRDGVVDVPTVHAAPTTREVYEFEVLPHIVGGEIDWKHPLVSYGPRRRVEAPMQAVRVVISKGAPRSAIVAALKQIADLIDASSSVGERTATPLATLSQWFE